MAFGVERIDWARPWFAGWRELGSFAFEIVDGQGSVCSALNAIFVSEFAKGAQGFFGLSEDISSGTSAKSEGDTVRAHTRFAHQIARAEATTLASSGCMRPTHCAEGD